MFPALEYIGISNFRLDEHPMYSKKCIKTWAMKLAVAGPVLTNFSMFPVFIGFKKQGGVRRRHSQEQKERLIHRPVSGRARNFGTTFGQ
ncbi:hypothetical protein KCU64_g61, partial [Aureobasidium melanogenum]